MQPDALAYALDLEHRRSGRFGLVCEEFTILIPEDLVGAANKEEIIPREDLPKLDGRLIAAPDVTGEPRRAEREASKAGLPGLQLVCGHVHLQAGRAIPDDIYLAV